MIQLIYISTAVRALAIDELREFLAATRKANLAKEITGMLVFHRGCFLQVLEGPKEAILALYGRVSEDKRHTDIKLVWTGEADERLFGDWSMGYADTSESPAGVEGYVDLDISFNELDRTGAAHFLNWFKQDQDCSSAA